MIHAGETPCTVASHCKHCPSEYQLRGEAKTVKPKKPFHETGDMIIDIRTYPHPDLLLRKKDLFPSWSKSGESSSVGPKELGLPKPCIQKEKA